MTRKNGDPETSLKVQEDTIFHVSKIDIQNPLYVICNVLTLPKTNINPKNHGF